MSNAHVAKENAQSYGFQTGAFIAGREVTGCKMKRDAFKHLWKKGNFILMVYMIVGKFSWRGRRDYDME